MCGSAWARAAAKSRRATTSRLAGEPEPGTTPAPRWGQVTLRPPRPQAQSHSEHRRSWPRTMQPAHAPSAQPGPQVKATPGRQPLVWILTCTPQPPAVRSSHMSSCPEDGAPRSSQNRKPHPSGAPLSIHPFHLSRRPHAWAWFPHLPFLTVSHHRRTAQRGQPPYLWATSFLSYCHLPYPGPCCPWHEWSH